MFLKKKKVNELIIYVHVRNVYFTVRVAKIIIPSSPPNFLSLLHEARNNTARCARMGF